MSSFEELRRRDPDGLILEEFKNSVYQLLNVCEFCQHLNRETYSCKHSGGPLNWNSQCSKFVKHDSFFDNVKAERLEHYATGDVHAFTQLDAFIDKAHNDPIYQGDEAHDVLYQTNTYELRHSGSDLAVRIQIHEGTSHKDAVRAVTKLLSWLESEPNMLEGVLPTNIHRQRPMSTEEFDRRVSQLEREYGLCEPYHLVIEKCGKETSANVSTQNK